MRFWTTTSWQVGVDAYVAKTPLTQLTADLGEIRKNQKQVQKAINSQQAPPIEDLVTQKLSEFNQECLDVIGKIEGEIKQVEAEFEATANYFGENKVAFDKFYEKVYKFKQLCK